MKRIQFVFLAIIALLSSSFTFDSHTVQNIDNGWYEATVKYTNYKTYYSATYSLNVKVEYNSVKAIDFGNGGSIHSGYNNEGYTYSGGYLSFRRNYDGDIISASTTVTTYDSDGTRSYQITIE